MKLYNEMHNLFVNYNSNKLTRYVQHNKIGVPFIGIWTLYTVYAFFQFIADNHKYWLPIGHLIEFKI